ncbi:hypothetical protein [Kangiella sediminilitoris]|uniref:MalT-like TPR region domain-containing protein n=1 Tax=Kangiella sediminilitoris TaxID=1144748 RepID=A0A1B3B7X1_9GAMM|nr:hypothetical protein [Kangiella sediminilitoris]AOE48894.1 hypothetical protein KS2013_165 [Kangiella sediminilitoris]
MVLIPFLLTAWLVKADYYQQLKDIEEQRLADLTLTKLKLDSISKEQHKFREEEKNLYLLIRAHSQAMHSDFISAEKTLLKIINSNASPDYKGRAYSILASVQQLQADYINSFYNMDKSLSYLSKMHNNKYKTNILQNAVSFYNDSDMLNFAMEHARRLLRLGVEGGSLADQCQAYYEMVVIEHSANRIELAESRIGKTQDICSKAKEVIILLHLTNMQAQIAMNKGNIQRAEKLLETNYQKVKNYGWKILTVSTENTIAELHFLKQEYKNAEEIALKALKSAEEISDIKRTKDATKVLAKIYSNLDQKEEALKFYQKFMQLEQKLSSSNRQRKLAFDKARQRLRADRVAKFEEAN